MILTRTLTLATILTLVACSAPLTPQERARLADDTYAAEMTACVAKSSTLEQSHACRADVRARWGVDGGAR